MAGNVTALVSGRVGLPTMRDQTPAQKLDFTGETAVVTGGAQGIGRACCETFASLGADVAIADIAIDPAEAAAVDLRETDDVTAVAVETDVTDFDSTAAMVDTVVDALGSIDILVNNAGMGNSEPFVEQSPDDWDFQIDICHYGTLNCSHAALDEMIDQSGGVIINFASDSYKGNDPGLSVYGAAKAANVSFTKTLAHEVGEHGIRVNCVSPGTTWTPATEDWLDQYSEKVLESYALNRLGQPEDIADAVSFLASDAAEWVTGQVLSVNGGYIRG